MAVNSTAAREPERDEDRAADVARIGSFASARAAAALRRGPGAGATADSVPAAAGDDPDPDEPEVDELKPGTRLLHGQYVIERFLNAGGFGITYRARDSLDRTVVIKECFPGAFCRRSNTIVRARSRGHHAEFRAVVRLFMQEARNLARLTHPNIVGVHQVFEDNDTAYMAIDYIEGRDLLDIIEDGATGFTPAEIVSKLKKLLDAVGFVHARGMLHRDISPDNILIDRIGQPILIDFGAAREQAAKTSRLLSALRVVKDGYSPQEFYIAGSAQGPSSDLYALAATFHHLISGEAPPDSQRRLAAVAEAAEDPYLPLAGRIEGYPPGFLEALDKAASVLPRDRIASAGEWLAMIERGAVRAPVPLVRAAPPAAETAAQVEAAETVPAAPRQSYAASILVGAGLVSAAVAGFLLLGPALDPGATVAVQDAPATGATARSVPTASPADAVPPMQLTEARAAAGAASGLGAVGAAAAAPRPAPLPNPVAAGRWELALPFETRPVNVGVDTVPVVARVLPSAAGLAANDWLAEGVGIYTVNDTWVSDQASIEEIVFDLPAGGAGIVMASLTVRGDNGEPFRQVSLAVPASRWVTLANGAVLRTRRVDGAWQVMVEGVPAAEPGGLAAGDILLAERRTGTALSGPLGVEALLGRLARAGVPEAVFEIRREGGRAEARFVLSGE